MRRILVPALILGTLSFSTLALVGCGETEKVEVKKEGPSGSTVQETKTTVKGDGGAAPAAPKP